VPKFELYKHNDELFNIYYSSAVAAILVGVLKCWTQFWKRTTQESFQQSLVEIGSVVSERKIFLISSNLITHLGVLALFSSNL
jgi:hypothetical protein